MIKFNKGKMKNLFYDRKRIFLQLRVRPPWLWYLTKNPTQPTKYFYIDIQPCLRLGNNFENRAPSSINILDPENHPQTYRIPRSNKF